MQNHRNTDIKTSVYCNKGKVFKVLGVSMKKVLILLFLVSFIYGLSAFAWNDNYNSQQTNNGQVDPWGSVWDPNLGFTNVDEIQRAKQSGQYQQLQQMNEQNRQLKQINRNLENLNNKLNQNGYYGW